MKKSLNVGLVGYKFMGKAHSFAIRNLGLFFDCDATLCQKVLCGRDEAWARKSADRFGWQDVETSWEALIARDDIDIIAIAAPSNAHKQIAIAAAQAGKHVFCEKPLALNTADATEIYEAANRYGVKHQVGFNYRFAPAVRLAKKMISEGRLGTIYHFRGNFLQDWIIDPEFPLVWRLDKSIAGSGSHGDLGAHVIDTARYLVGEITKVSGVSKTFIPKRPLVGRMEGLSASAAGGALGDVTVDDATLFLAEFENGALGVFEASRFAQGHKNALSFEINGSLGSIKFEFERMNELWYFNAQDEPGLQGYRLIQATEGVHPYIGAWWPAGHVIGFENTFFHEWYEFTQAIANDTPASPDFADGVACCRVLDAVERSAATGVWESPAMI